MVRDLLHGGTWTKSISHRSEALVWDSIPNMNTNKLVSFRGANCCRPSVWLNDSFCPSLARSWHTGAQVLRRLRDRAVLWPCWGASSCKATKRILEHGILGTSSSCPCAVCYEPGGWAGKAEARNRRNAHQVSKFAPCSRKGHSGVVWGLPKSVATTA